MAGTTTWEWDGLPRAKDPLLSAWEGKISAEELSQVLKRLGESCSLSACKKMVKGVDGNGDGFIDLNEFTRMMMSGKKLG